MATIYVVATTTIFIYTVYDQLSHSTSYFKALMTYLADNNCVFVLYNMILSMAIMLYKLFTWLFFEKTMEGEIIVQFKGYVENYGYAQK